MTTVSIDLNADLGEECGDDTAMLDIVTSANVCCGVHAGSPLALHRTLTAAKERGVTVGAHPSYPDRANFGRFPMNLPLDEMAAVLRYQIAAFAALNGNTVPYIKAHGALYNDAFTNDGYADLIVLEAATRNAAVMHQSGSAVEASTQRYGVPFIAEVFADRAYTADGTLAKRGQDGAVLHDPDQIAQRVVQMVTTGTVTAITGETISLNADSVCLHGDTPGAISMAQAVRSALSAANVSVRSAR